MLIVACVLCPLAAALAVVTCGFRPVVNKLPIAASVAVVLGAGAIAQQRDTSTVLGVFHADAVTGYLMAVVAAVAAVATVALNQQLTASLEIQSVGPLRARAHAAALPALLACTVITLCGRDVWLRSAGAAGIAVVVLLALLVARTRAAVTGAIWLGVSLGIGGLAIVLGEAGPRASGVAGGGPALVALGVTAYAGFPPLQCWRMRALPRLPFALAALTSAAVYTVAFDVLVRQPSTVDVAAVMRWGALVGLVVAAYGVVTSPDFVRSTGYLGIAGMSSVLLGLGAHAHAATAALLQLSMVAVATTVLYIVSAGLAAMTGSRRIATVHGLWRRNRIAAAALVTASGVLVVPPVLGFFSPSLTYSGTLIWWGLRSGDGMIFSVLLVASVVVIGTGAAAMAWRMLSKEPASHPDLAVTARMRPGKQEILFGLGALFSLGIALIPETLLAETLRVVAQFRRP